MRNFSNNEDFSRYKEVQNQSGVFGTHVFSGKKDMQYLSEQEREALATIPDEAVIVINKFDLLNPKNQTTHARNNELEVCVPVWSPHMEKTLLYALTSGTAYTVKNEQIYIWYKPIKGLEGAGFYKLKRFAFLNDGRTVKYFLDGNEKLSNPL